MIEVVEAILARRSVRDFSPRPVPRETILKIMEAALHSPSGGNSQPWEVFIATGQTLERIRQTCRARFQQGPGGPAPGGPPPLPAYIQERMSVIRNERLKLLGLDPAKPESARIFMEWGSRLFGAPALVVVCMDKALSSYLEIGLFVQTVCLAAQGYGVDSFIAGSFLSQADVIRQELEIPEALNPVTAIGLGYAQAGSVINTYRSPRRPLNEVVRYKE